MTRAELLGRKVHFVTEWPAGKDVRILEDGNELLVLDAAQGLAQHGI